jgi:hypothetical protein
LPPSRPGQLRHSVLPGILAAEVGQESVTISTQRKLQGPVAAFA